MEEDKNIKLKRRLHMISNIFSYTIIAILMIIGSFLVFYVIDGKICKSKGKNPLFGLYTIISPSMTGTINVYDVAFVKRVNTNDLKKGDIITFYSENTFFRGTPITHRIINVTESSETGRLFTVKGDANPKEDDEKVKASNVVGKVYFKIPQLGRIQFFLASKSGWMVAILIPALAIISYDLYKLFRLVLLKSKILSLENQHGNI